MIEIMTGILPTKSKHSMGMIAKAAQIPAVFISLQLNFLYNGITIYAPKALNTGSTTVRNTENDGRTPYSSVIIVGTQFVMPSLIIPCRNDGIIIIKSPDEMTIGKKPEGVFLSAFFLFSDILVIDFSQIRIEISPNKKANNITVPPQIKTIFQFEYLIISVEQR